jgi:hypothetical protein
MENPLDGVLYPSFGAASIVGGLSGFQERPTFGFDIADIQRR